MWQFVLSLFTLTGIAHVVTVVAVGIRVVMKRPPTGVALAWILIVAVVPFVGVALYLLIGERRISLLRTHRIANMKASIRELANEEIRHRLSNVEWNRHQPIARGMDQLGRTLLGYPTVHGNRFELMSDPHDMLRAIARDIDAAQTCVLMEFYIWNEGGLADAVIEALIRAAGRGVLCRVLVDALGGRPWWKGNQPQQLREAGVEVITALPVGPLRTLTGRTDLRLHRKIVIIDGKIAWTGSMNLVDPDFFKQNAGVGKWVDALVRIEGCAVAPLAATLVSDWMLETGVPIPELLESAGVKVVESQGDIDIQVIPSGPGETLDGLLQMLLALINSAREELILTTPYFVPDDSLLRALRGAAARGVDVSLIVPEKVDSFMTNHACRSYYEDLLEVGVKIYLFKGGLLHTKSAMADGAISMFGTANFDMRSLWLNYEVSLFVYDTAFAASLRQLQLSYTADSQLLTSADWAKRPFRQRFIENAMRIISPLL